MMDFYNELNQLFNDINEKKISRSDAEIRIQKMKEKYNEEVFPKFCFTPKPKPWSKEYLSELKKMRISGVCSEEFILHLAEVNDYVSKRQRTVMVFEIVAGVLSVLAVVITLIKIIGHFAR